MKTNKSYVLSVPLNVFMEKTLKVEFGRFIQENNGVISPDETKIGEFEDIAIFRSGINEYELPSIFWKYFDEIDGEEAPVPFSPLKEEPEKEVEFTGGSHTITGNLAEGRTYPVKVQTINTIVADTISVRPSYVLAEGIKKLDSAEDIEPSTEQLFAFYHDHLRKLNSSWHGPVGIDTDSATALETARVLYKLYQRKTALLKLATLIEAEQKAIQEEIDSHYL